MQVRRYQTSIHPRGAASKKLPLPLSGRSNYSVPPSSRNSLSPSIILANQPTLKQMHVTISPREGSTCGRNCHFTIQYTLESRCTPANITNHLKQPCLYVDIIAMETGQGSAGYSCWPCPCLDCLVEEGKLWLERTG